MTGIVKFHALAFDHVDGRFVEGQLVDCAGPALAIQTAQGQWKIFGHAGAVAFSRTSFLGADKPAQRQVLRWFGQVPNEYRAEKAIG